MAQNISSNNQTPSTGKAIGAALAGGLTSSAIVSSASLPNILLRNKICKINRSISKDEVKILNSAGDQILKSTGLTDTGIKMLKKFPNEVTKYMKNKFASLPKKMQKFLKMLTPEYQVALGRNSYFCTDNSIVNPDKMALVKFHEIGHAINFNKLGKNKAFWGNLFHKMRTDIPVSNKFRMLMGLVTPAIVLTALFKNKKAEGEKTQGFWDKTTTFVKNNAGKLMFLSSLPIVLEEAIASYKGEQLVKKIISPELFKKVKTSNRLGLATYAVLASAVGIGTMLAVKVRDKIAQPNLK